MDIIPHKDSGAALGALLERDAESLAKILRSCLSAHICARTPENIAKRTAQQLILLSPDALLQLDWADDPELAEPYSNTLAEALAQAFLFHSRNIPIHRFANAFAKPPLPPEPLAACLRLFLPEPSNPLSKINDETKKVTLSRCKWRWTLDLLLESGISSEQNSAAQAFLICAKSGGAHAKAYGEKHLSATLQTLRSLMDEDTPQGRLAVQWLASLHDVHWGSFGPPECCALLSLANARREALAIGGLCPGDRARAAAQNKPNLRHKPAL